MVTTVLILAAGEASRWAGPVPKQLVDINGEALIARTVRQVRELFHVEPHIITNNLNIAGHGIDSCSPFDNKWLLETLYYTIQLWTGRVIVLLGDVYYSEAVLLNIYRDIRSIIFYGRLLEIYSLSFWGHKVITEAIVGALHYAEDTS